MNQPTTDELSDLPTDEFGRPRLPYLEDLVRIRAEQWELAEALTSDLQRRQASQEIALRRQRIPIEVKMAWLEANLHQELQITKLKQVHKQNTLLYDELYSQVVGAVVADRFQNDATQDFQQLVAKVHALDLMDLQLEYSMIIARPPETSAANVDKHGPRQGDSERLAWDDFWERALRTPSVELSTRDWPDSTRFLRWVKGTVETHGYLLNARPVTQLWLAEYGHVSDDTVRRALQGSGLPVGFLRTIPVPPVQRLPVPLPEHPPTTASEDQGRDRATG